MASTKEIRTRLASTASTRQITSAMKMVSAAKLKKAQDAILLLRPYAQKLQEILGSISSSDEGSSEFTKERQDEKVLIVIVTSNRGLCGAFNVNVIKQAIQLVQDKYASQLAAKKVSFLAIGKKGGDFLRRRNLPIVELNTSLVDKPNFELVSAYAEKLMKEFSEGKYDKIEIVYNQFKNAAIQVLKTEQYLPVPKAAPVSSKVKGSTSTTNYDFIFEPSKEQIVKELIPKSLKVQLFKSVLDSIASEHGARMTAMHKATDNASELLRELRIQYNKARQSTITNEILEIVGGAEALKG
jgi:F-type H+-transporting ATPase subunit gamma